MKDLAKYPGLARRPGSQNWYYKVRVPTVLVPHYGGRTQIWRSLGTADRRDAMREWRHVHDTIQSEFEQKLLEIAQPAPVGIQRRSHGEHVRRIRMAALAAGEPRKTLTHVAGNELARTWFAERLAVRSLADPLDRDEAIADLEAARAVLLDASHPDTLVSAQQAAEILLERFGYAGVPGEPSYEHLAGALRMAMLELNRLELERLSAGPDNAIRAALFNVSPVTGTVTGTASMGAPTALSHLSIREAANRFWEDERPNRSKTDLTEIRKVRGWLDLIVEFFGPTNPVTAIDAPRCGEFLRLLERLPANRNKKYDDLALDRLAEAAAKDGSRRMAYRTRQSYLTELAKLINWCRSRQLLHENPLDYLPKQRRSHDDVTQRVPFTVEQLRTIFAAPLYTGCKDDERGYSTPGDAHPRRARFWLPLLGLFTGARAGELCQLRTKDIETTPADTPFIQVRKEEEWMVGKTPSAIRGIPIHPELVRIGFLEFVDRQRRTQEQFLFPEMLEEGNKPSARFSKLFGTFRKSLGLKQRGLDFHSFRHTAREALKRVEVMRSRGADLDHEIDLIFGWAGGKEMRNRYAKGAWPVDELAELVKQIVYPGLDLSHLHTVGTAAPERRP